MMDDLEKNKPTVGLNDNIRISSESVQNEVDVSDTENAAEATHISEQKGPEEEASVSRDSASNNVIHATAIETVPKNYSAADVTSMREALGKEAQQLIEEINAKRVQDTQLLADFKEVLEKHVQKTCSDLEQAMFEIYERESQIMQGKLQDLFTVLDRISHKEAELDQFKQALGALYRDMAQTV